MLHRHIASQRNAAVMKKVNVGSTKVLISTTFIYKEIMFNTAQHNILGFLHIEVPQKNHLLMGFFYYINYSSSFLQFTPNCMRCITLKFLKLLRNPSHIVVIGCVAATCFRVIILNSGFESAVFPGSKLEVTDQAIFQNTIFPQAILL